MNLISEQRFCISKSECWKWKRGVKAWSDTVSKASSIRIHNIILKTLFSPSGNKIKISIHTRIQKWLKRLKWAFQASRWQRQTPQNNACVLSFFLSGNTQYSDTIPNEGTIPKVGETFKHLMVTPRTTQWSSAIAYWFLTHAQMPMLRLWHQHDLGKLGFTCPHEYRGNWVLKNPSRRFPKASCSVTCVPARGPNAEKIESFQKYLYSCGWGLRQ